MFFTADQVTRLSEQEIVTFLNGRVSEATGYIDYKVDIDTQKPERAHAELLKDVSGFANANGGHLLIGVSEPDRENDGAAFVGGVTNGAAIATAIEQRCAAGIDPRIPGLRVVPVQLAGGRWVVVVHVPPSPMRPHMAIHAPTGTRTYFIRHSETTMPMTSSEVRHAVLSAAAGSSDARAYATEQETRIAQCFPAGASRIILSATPLVPVEVLWDVTADPWQQVVFGNNRSAGRRNVICSGNARTPTVEGIAAADSRVDPRIIFEIHRTGYIGAGIQILPHPDLNPTTVCFWKSYLEFLDSFGLLCDDALRTARSDRPYLMQVHLLGTRNSVLAYGNFYAEYSAPQQRDEIRLPDLRRESGQSFVEPAQAWKPVVWNAYGLDFQN